MSQQTPNLAGMTPSPRKRLLCLSNGHGEDAIALAILSSLRQHPNAPQLFALPLVGKGSAYLNSPIASSISLVGVTQAMPSGGFIYMDGRQFVRDIKGGLVQLTLKQLKAVRQWGQQGGAVLAVGDLVPLLFAWWSGVPYGFVGTAKSDYYLRDEQRWLPRATWLETLERWSGSVYLPWERWLMKHPRCKAVFPRDTLTATGLSRWNIPIADLGNPMMDGLEPRHSLPQLEATPNITQDCCETSLTLVLLPGSRVPEAYRNWERILQAVGSIQQHLPQRSLRLLGAIAPSLDLQCLCQALVQQRWHIQSPSAFRVSISQSSSDSTAAAQAATRIHLIQPETRQRPSHCCILTTSEFGDCLHAADVAIATTGTATEQCVGLGKPALILPGEGPQFTAAFAEAQTRLLGPSAIIVDPPTQAGHCLAQLLSEPARLEQIRQNGRRRMGSPGAGDRIARHLMRSLGWDD